MIDFCRKLLFWRVGKPYIQRTGTKNSIGTCGRSTWKKRSNFLLYTFGVCAPCIFIAIRNVLQKAVTMLMRFKAFLVKNKVSSCCPMEKSRMTRLVSVLFSWNGRRPIVSKGSTSRIQDVGRSSQQV